MPTNFFPGIGYTKFGRDWNFFQKVSIATGTFGGGSVDGYQDGYQPDMLITFSTQSAIFLNESTGIVEYSFNGTTVHGELDGSVGSLTKMLTFNHRRIAKIWFRIKSGSSGPITVSVQAWAIP
jgi:hypothetical protein